MSAPVPSPCVLVCTLDPVTRLCLGCLRTPDEIAGWMEMDDGERRAVLARIRQRDTEVERGSRPGDDRLPLDRG